MESGYYFKWNMTYYLSYPKSSSFYSRRDDTTDIPRERLYINISVKDVLYINDWRGCLLLSLSSTTVLLALRADNGAAAFTSFLCPAGYDYPKKSNLNNSPSARNTENVDARCAT